VWGRRRPYIFIGTLVNVAALVWMAVARDIPSLAVAYVLLQFSSNAVQAPFHALLPDIVPPRQRGLTSGIMGLLQTLGTIGGVIIAGFLIDASRPLPVYQQTLWLVYSGIIAVLVALMLVTIFSVRERRRESFGEIAQEVRSASDDGQAVERHSEGGSEGVVVARGRFPWLSRSLLVTIGGTVLAALVVWGIMAVWNAGNLGGVRIGSDVQQVVLEVIVTVGILRIFDFKPRRDPDFAWVFITRLIMMLGIHTIQTFLQYYMRDAVGVEHPEQQTTNFLIIVSLTSLGSAFAAGWLSDHFGRKRMVYIAGGMMAAVGLVFVITHSLPLVLAAGALFGLGYGAYGSVDWALVADVLPSDRNFARDMGVWNIALSLPQVVAPVLGGPLIDHFTRAGNPVLGFQLLFIMAIGFCVLGTVTVRFIRGAR
ncbi:MAG: MFS transporter, partial [Ktedonobacteraceae bacterium]|nr:MFS transporter [Ktedonobacteraceae bacterium]